jgi:hypothetical protein
VASLAPAVEPIPRRPRPQPAGRARRRRGVAGGAAWILVAAALLAGVVAMNVAVLRLNMRLDDLSRDRATLRARNAALESRLSSAAAAPRIQQLAQTRLGLAPAAADATSYVTLPPGH